MDTNSVTSKDLLQKVYNQLDSIDVSTLSLRDLSDFLEVVQKGRFLETSGSNSFPYFGGFGPTKSFTNETGLNGGTEDE